MADIEKIKEALQRYTGDNETLNHFVSVVTTELGEDWFQTIFDTMTNLNQDEQSRLDYVYRHYAAVSAWNEAQFYLQQDGPLDSELITERLPVLEHWLAFYQAPGLELVEQLKQRLSTDIIQEIPNQPQTDENVSSTASLEHEAIMNETNVPTPAMIGRIHGSGWLKSSIHKKDS